MTNKNKVKPIGTCKSCYGYGFWAIGARSPMGPMDAGDGCPSEQCKECGAGGRIKKQML